MIRAIRLFEILHVTARATGGSRRVRAGPDVALGAPRAGVRASEREPGLRMIKLRALPLHGGMAGVASGGEPGGQMIWVGALLEIGQVASRALLGSCREIVPSVTLRARQVDMRAGKRKRCLVVREVDLLPLSGGVAELAGSRFSSCHMIRLGGLVVILDVAARAVCRDSSILPAHVAGRAGHRRVCASQLKRAEVMVELRLLPVRRAVAVVALGGDVALRMIRIGSLAVIRQMAAWAVQGSARKTAVHVAR